MGNAKQRQATTSPPSREGTKNKKKEFSKRTGQDSYSRTVTSFLAARESLQAGEITRFLTGALDNCNTSTGPEPQEDGSDLHTLIAVEATKRNQTFLYMDRAKLVQLTVEEAEQQLSLLKAVIEKMNGKQPSQVLLTLLHTAVSELFKAYSDLISQELGKKTLSAVKTYRVKKALSRIHNEVKYVRSIVRKYGYYEYFGDLLVSLSAMLKAYAQCSVTPKRVKRMMRKNIIIYLNTAARYYDQKNRESHGNEKGDKFFTQELIVKGVELQRVRQELGLA